MDFNSYQKSKFVEAAFNEGSAPQDVVVGGDYGGTVYTVPPGWAIVKEGEDRAVLMPRAVFDKTYAKVNSTVSLDGFVNTVNDLRHTDALTAANLNSLAQRVSALEVAAGLPSPGPAV